MKLFDKFVRLFDKTVCLFSRTGNVFYGVCAAVLLFSACEARMQPVAEKQVTVAPASVDLSMKTRHIKPGADVKLVNPDPLFVEPGQASPVELVLSTAQDHGVLRVQISADQELSILSQADTLEFALRPGENYAIPLQVVAQTSGRFYIRLQTSLETNGKTLGRSLVVAVQVGASGQVGSFGQSSIQHEKVAHSSSISADNVISLPAQETTNTSE